MHEECWEMDWRRARCIMGSHLAAWTHRNKTRRWSVVIWARPNFKLCLLFGSLGKPVGVTMPDHSGVWMWKEGFFFYRIQYLTWKVAKIREIWSLISNNGNSSAHYNKRLYFLQTLQAGLSCFTTPVLKSRTSGLCTKLTGWASTSYSGTNPKTSKKTDNM